MGRSSVPFTSASGRAVVSFESLHPESGYKKWTRIPPVKHQDLHGGYSPLAAR